MLDTTVVAMHEEPNGIRVTFERIFPPLQSSRSQLRSCIH
jgi:hypothetical protein